MADEHSHAPHFDPQDMMNMGGLRKTMPVTFITFLIGGLSLAGFPLITAGFWSKDEILADAWLRRDTRLLGRNAGIRHAGNRRLPDCFLHHAPTWA